MNPSRILLVNPKIAEPGHWYHFPLGLTYVATALKQHGFSVTGINLCHKRESVGESIRRAMQAGDIDIVATGGISLFWREISEVLSEAKRCNPQVKTIVGGPLVTAQPQLAMQHLPIDIGVLGEGEITTVEAVRALESGTLLENVDGIVFRANDDPCRFTRPREPIMNLDGIPYPDYDILDFGTLLDTIESEENTYLEACERPRPAEIIASRSCPFSCTFCYHPLGKKYRQRSVDNVIGEVEMLISRYRINVINLLDELLAADEERLLEFSRRIAPLGVRWVANLRVDKVTRKALQAMKDSGAFLIFFGVESINDEVLRSMRKGITREQIESAFRLAGEVGIRANGHIILGDVADTEETVAESLQWVKSHPEYNIQTDFVLAIPDAPIYRQARARGLIPDELAHVRNKFPIVNMSRIPERRFQKLVDRLRRENREMAFAATATLLAARELENDPLGASLFRLRCPVCGREAEYRRGANVSRTWTGVVCRHCHRCLRAPSAQIFPKAWRAEYGGVERGILRAAMSLARAARRVAGRCRGTFLKGWRH